ncbi:FkbM family methyltransferase [Alisedimentitalea sp. MJ-SS2]|uniref:FkbM family methyltransferase n=1 Tax=Aliisedimentitalea sp. MJ-SS2 TaxID=3049795 RepID=UPI00290D31BB|nr:FkbM family methyltransferase [Alisedimentitalea sp. MJ-SS2]MDU8929292.1 FkbM family methyltransferase [Alisedimentitalea sp. MJ-SS2]
MNAISYYFARKFLNKANRDHMARYPQLACYSFDLITTFIHLEGQYERDQLELLARDVFPKLSHPSTCLDVGANIGNHSVHFAQHFDKVISFEPHPRNFALLSINAGLSEAIIPLNVGASSEGGSAEIVEDKMNLAASSLERSVGRDGNWVKFDLVRIDEVPQVQACDAISFIKFDIEGHEAEAIKGAAETIKRHRPVVMLEILADEIENGTSASIEALRELGYAHFHEPVEAGTISQLPKVLRKAARSLYAIFTGKRANKAGRLVPVGRLDKRNYLMVLCSIDAPGYGG